MSLVESLIIKSWPDELSNQRPSTPFQRLTYDEAIRDYGTDKPDLRIPWKILDYDHEFGGTLKEPADTSAAFFVAKNTHGVVSRSLKNEWKRLLRMKESTSQVNFSPVSVHHLLDFRSSCLSTSRKNLLRSRNLTADHSLTSTRLNQPILLFSGKQAPSFLIYVCFSWGTNKTHIRETLGQLRNYIGGITGIRSEKRFEWTWIVDFPLFVQNEEGQLESAHHPFTAPANEFLSDLSESRNLQALKGTIQPRQTNVPVLAQHYDLVMNGIELGGGSARIHNAELQKHVFEILKLPLDPLVCRRGI